MKYKKGDTLIEVTMAIGIFSMIAIAVVAIMNSGTSGTQTALETTLAREEIDAQAEALRFIQASYISDKDSIVEDDDTENRFQKLWEAITELAVDPDGAYTNYAPNTCEEAYSGDVFDHAFIINTRQLGNFTTVKDGTNGDSVLLTTAATCHGGEACLQTASTYPRLVFQQKSSNTEESSVLVGPSSSQKVYQAEGIYIIAVRDSSNGTAIVDKESGGTGVVNKAAFYDFYIRTCWYGSGSNTPSTISTVIRLYDPDALSI